MPRAHSPHASRSVGTTLEQWADMDEDEPGELVDGELEEEEVPTILHEAVVSWLIFTLSSWLIPLGGWIFGSEHKLAVSARRGRKPDVTIYLPGASPPPKSASLGRRPPSGVIEVVSPRPRDGKRDRVDKLHDYAAFGVHHYWLVDPQLRTVEIFELHARRKPVVVLSTSGGIVHAPGCPGLRLDLDALWKEMDRLPDDDVPPAPPSSIGAGKRTKKERAGRRRR